MIWMVEFITNLNDKERKQLTKVKTPGNAVLHFGHRVESRSIKCVTIPLKFGKKETDGG